MKTFLSILSIVIFCKCSVISQNLIIPWDAPSGLYLIKENSEYLKFRNVSYETFFSVNDDKSRNVNKVIYKVALDMQEKGYAQFCEIKLELEADIVYIYLENLMDQTTGSYSIPLRQFEGADNLRLFKSIKIPKQTAVVQAKNQGFIILDLPINFLNYKLVLHLQPITI